MISTILPKVIKLDGALELLRCPDYSLGWSAAEIMITYTPGNWHLPETYGHLREKWERRHSNERSDQKVALREVYLNEDHTLACRLQSTEWREVRPLHEACPVDANALVRRQSNGRCEMLLPNIGVVHVVASTRDGWILVVRRSNLVHYHPGSWSATYEEGLAPVDLSGREVFQLAARRGLAEELTAEASVIALDAFRVVSVVLEQPLGNPAVIVVADLPLSRDELRGHGSSDELDVGSLIAIPIDRKRLCDVVAAPFPTFAPQSRGWHPTARYRLLAAMAHFFGEEAAAEALMRLHPSAS